MSTRRLVWSKASRSLQGRRAATVAPQGAWSTQASSGCQTKCVPQRRTAYRLRPTVPAVSRNGNSSNANSIERQAAATMRNGQRVSAARTRLMQARGSRGTDRAGKARPAAAWNGARKHARLESDYPCAFHGGHTANRANRRGFPPPSRGRVREGMRLLIVRARVVRQQPCTSRPTGDLPNLLASSTEVATAPSRTQQTKSGPIDLRRRPTLGRQQAQRIAPSFFIRRNIDCALSGVSGVPNFSSQSSASALSL